MCRSALRSLVPAELQMEPRSIPREICAITRKRARPRRGRTGHPRTLHRSSRIRLPPNDAPWRSEGIPRHGPVSDLRPWVPRHLAVMMQTWMIQPMLK